MHYSNFYKERQGISGMKCLDMEISTHESNTTSSFFLRFLAVLASTSFLFSKLVV